MKLAHLIVGIALALFLGLARANEALPLAEDPLLEKRLIAISEELRCLVCQNESLAGSRADLANDLRREIRSLIKDGQSDAQIMEFMVSRYGDFVRYRPPVNATTWLLWGGPFLLLLVGVGALIHFLRRRTTDVPPTTLSADEQRRAQALLNNTDPHA